MYFPHIPMDCPKFLLSCKEHCSSEVPFVESMIGATWSNQLIPSPPLWPSSKALSASEDSSPSLSYSSESSLSYSPPSPDSSPTSSFPIPWANSGPLTPRTTTLPCHPLRISPSRVPVHWSPPGDKQRTPSDLSSFGSEGSARRRIGLKEIKKGRWWGYTNLYDFLVQLKQVMS